MITFLPSGDFEQCARILDLARLNRQISESIQIGKLLYEYQRMRDGHGIPTGITFSPVIQLWISSNISSGDNFDGAGMNGTVLIPELLNYCKALNEEWGKHKGKDHGSFIGFDWTRIGGYSRLSHSLQWPEEVHKSHRSHLLEKDYAYYLRKFSQEQLSNCKYQKYVWRGPRII